MLELKDTVDDMLSDDYKARALAELRQIEIRYNKLDAMLRKWDEGRLPFVPTTPRDPLERSAMPWGRTTAS